MPLTEFTMNGYLWRIEFVDANDPMLVDRTGTLTVATTDPSTLTLYLSYELYRNHDFMNRVLIHELGHCAIFSFNLLDDIHRMVHPKYWVDAEEWICNFIADYGSKIFSIAYSVLGDDAITILPYELERLVA